LADVIRGQLFALMEVQIPSNVEVVIKLNVKLNKSHIRMKTKL